MLSRYVSSMRPPQRGLSLANVSKLNGSSFNNGNTQSFHRAQPDLRIAERELMALERAPARKTTAPRTPKVKPKRTQKGSAPVHPTISAAIAEVLNEHGALPGTEIAEHIK